MRSAALVLVSTLFLASSAFARPQFSGVVDLTPSTPELPLNGVFYVLMGDATSAPTSVSFTSSVFGSGTLESTTRYGGLIVYTLPEGPGPISVSVEADRPLSTNLELSDVRDDTPPSAPLYVSGDWAFPTDDTIALVFFSGGEVVEVRTASGRTSTFVGETGATCDTVHALDVAGHLGPPLTRTCEEIERGGCTAAGAATPGVVIPALAWRFARRRRRR